MSKRVRPSSSGQVFYYLVKVLIRHIVLIIFCKIPNILLFNLKFPDKKIIAQGCFLKIELVMHGAKSLSIPLLLLRF